MYTWRGIRRGQNSRYCFRDLLLKFVSRSDPNFILFSLSDFTVASYLMICLFCVPIESSVQLLKNILGKLLVIRGKAWKSFFNSTIDPTVIFPLARCQEVRVREDLGKCDTQRQFQNQIND